MDVIGALNHLYITIFSNWIIFQGKFPCALPDVVLGHEISGFVVGLGSQVESIHVGQRVAVNAARYLFRNSTSISTNFNQLFCNFLDLVCAVNIVKTITIKDVLEEVSAMPSEYFAMAAGRNIVLLMSNRCFHFHPKSL